MTLIALENVTSIILPTLGQSLTQFDSIQGSLGNTKIFFRFYLECWYRNFYFFIVSLLWHIFSCFQSTKGRVPSLGIWKRGFLIGKKKQISLKILGFWINSQILLRKSENKQKTPWIKPGLLTMPQATPLVPSPRKATNWMNIPSLCAWLYSTPS